MEQGGGRERDTGNAHCPAEILCHKRLVSPRHKEIEFRLLSVAQEKGLDSPYSEFQVYGLTVLHSHGRISIDPPETDAQLSERIVYLSLHVGYENPRCGFSYFTYMYHFINNLSQSAGQTCIS